MARAPGASLGTALHNMDSVKCCPLSLLSSLRFQFQLTFEITGKDLPDDLSYIKHSTVVEGKYIHVFKGKQMDTDVSQKNYYMDINTDTWQSYDDSRKFFFTIV